MSELKQCPYNRKHLVSDEKFVWHVSECKKKHPHLQLKECPYNSTHFLSIEEYDHHISRECGERPSREQAKVILEYNSKHTGGISPNPAQVENRRNRVQLRQNEENKNKKKEMENEPISIISTPSGGGEGFTLNKIKRSDPKEEEAKKREIEEKLKIEEQKKNEEKKKEDCEGQIF